MGSVFVSMVTKKVPDIQGDRGVCVCARVCVCGCGRASEFFLGRARIHLFEPFRDEVNPIEAQWFFYN